MEYQNLSDEPEPKWSFLLYGPSKSYKTIFSSQFPQVLHILTEPGRMGGLSSVRHSKRPFLKITKWSQAIELLTKLRSKDPNVDTLHVSSLTYLSHICLREIYESYNRERALIQDYGLNHDRVINWVLRMCELPYTLIFECNDRIVTIKDEDGNEFNQIDPDLPGRLARDIPAVIDEVFYMYRKRVRDKEKKEWVQKAIILTVPDARRGVAIAGDRSLNLDQEEEADYESIIKKINS